MRKFISLCFFMLLAIASWSQTTKTISGKITDSKSNPVAGASINLLNTNIGTVSDAKGEFTLNAVPPGRYDMEVTAVGFATKNLVLETENMASLNIQLADAT